MLGDPQTGEEAAAYGEFLSGKRTAVVAHNIHTDISYIGGFITDTAAGGEKEGIRLGYLLAGR